MLKIGVLGAGHLGKIHLRLLQQSERYNLIGFYDHSEENANAVEQEFGYKKFASFSDLLAEVDVIDIVTPTLSHYDYALASMKNGKHIFIEKPISTTVSEAEDLLMFSKQFKIKGQVGHVERFNPAFIAVKDEIQSPMFIESHRLAEFNPRGTDVPVVLDLMIHDLDIILSVVKSRVKNISASGVAILSKTPDIANARIEFENGCVANITASRLSMKNMRKSRFFQKDAYITVDYLEKNCTIIKMKDAPEVPDDFDIILQNAEGEKKQIYFNTPDVTTSNAILKELESLADAIEHNTTPVVTLEDAAEALRVAYQIINAMST